MVYEPQINKLESPTSNLIIIYVINYKMSRGNIRKIRYTEIKAVTTSIISAAFVNNTTSLAYKMYNELSFEKFKPSDRNIVNEVIPVITYSYMELQGGQQKVISDNVDRSELWMCEQDAIDTRGVLTYDSDFDREQFKESYCKHIDFISHFE